MVQNSNDVNSIIVETPMPNTRLNITLPTPIVDDIKSLYGQRGLSIFLEEAAREKLERLKQEHFRGLIEGYQATAEETKRLLEQFERAATEQRDV